MNQAQVYVERGGVLLRPDLQDSREIEGILNPATAGDYLLYRAVGRGNYSRLMAAKLETAAAKEDKTVTAHKLNKVVMEPSTVYELAREGHGGIEDPRVTELPDGSFVMFYTGYGRGAGFKKQTPVVAAAISDDSLIWRRQGRIIFAKYSHHGRVIDFNLIPNKDTVLFPEKINGRYALLHRPMFTRKQEAVYGVPWRGIWYAEADTLAGPWENNTLILKPMYDWENGGVGAGVPPIHLKDVWVHIYHGFTKGRVGHRRYSAGVFITPHNEPQRVIYRSDCAILEPLLAEETAGTVPGVVFPTAVWQTGVARNTLAIFWGAADTRIMWGTLHLPSEVLAVSADVHYTA